MKTAAATIVAVLLFPQTGHAAPPSLSVIYTCPKGKVVIDDAYGLNVECSEEGVPTIERHSVTSLSGQLPQGTNISPGFVPFTVN